MSLASDLGEFKDRSCAVCHTPFADQRVLVVACDSPGDTRDAHMPHVALILFVHGPCWEAKAGNEGAAMDLFIAGLRRPRTVYAVFKAEPFPEVDPLT